jgi:hypothetical protein
MSAARPTTKCSHCGAAQKPDDSFCWLCFSPLSPAVTETDDDAVNPFHPDASVSQSAGAGSLAAVGVTSLLLFVIFLVTLVLYQAVPGVAILFGLFVLLPLLRTIVVSWQRAERGRPVGIARRIEMFLTSLAVMVGLVLLWGLSAVVGLWVLCVTALGAGQGGSDPTSIILFTAASIVGVVLFLTSMLVWSRYRKDVDRD